VIGGTLSWAGGDGDKPLWGGWGWRRILAGTGADGYKPLWGSWGWRRILAGTGGDGVSLCPSVALYSGYLRLLNKFWDNICRIYTVFGGGSQK